MISLKQPIIHNVVVLLFYIWLIEIIRKHFYLITKINHFSFFVKHNVIINTLTPYSWVTPSEIENPLALRLTSAYGPDVLSRIKLRGWSSGVKGATLDLPVFLVEPSRPSLMSNFGTKFHFEVEKVKKCLNSKYKNIYSV